MTRPSTDLCGSCDFSALVGILGEAAGVVANDSGGMHLAAAVGAPVVGLFLSTDPGWTGPLGAKATALRSGIECAPCFRRTCDRGVECTRSLAVEQVLEALTGVVEVSH
jgi:ADP-heptose:LPS heptosyltransferase